MDFLNVIPPVIDGVEGAMPVLATVVGYSGDWRTMNGHTNPLFIVETKAPSIQLILEKTAFFYRIVDYGLSWRLSQPGQRLNRAPQVPSKGLRGQASSMQSGGVV